MDLTQYIDKGNLPQHIAIIMDGNGRWANQRGKERIFGHENGIEAVRDTVKAAAEIGVKYLTFFAFSTENWLRPLLEVETLMDLLVRAIENETPELNKNGVRLRAIGDLEALPQRCREQLHEAIELTSKNEKLIVTVALSYSARWEIVRAAQKIAQKVADRLISPDQIDQDMFQACMETPDTPDPDLLIRTSGEQRISNFLLWQIAYAELYFTPVFWPDFRREHLYQAIIDYQKRERRFGKVEEREVVSKNIGI
ncbi:MAG: isoprenyl transferase [Bacteroidales bacterium]|nr:isoprenyl transferase [Bacteroidales bacterium]